MADHITTACLVDAPPELARAFEAEGFRTLELAASPAPFFDLPAELDRAGVVPDLVVQVERLGARSVLTGLDSLDCPVLFWAIDPHLNAHWHSAYARLFDVVCSTQKAWIPRLARQGAGDVRWLPWFGLDRPFAPWGEREHGLAFVGRVTSQRPVRKWMIELLRERGAAANPAIFDAMTRGAMLDLYSRSKLIPNESILGEVNFRLFEGACCGCLVVGQDIDEQAELFEPGREMDTYAHVVELDDKLAWYLNNDKLVHAMARAAHARVQAEHLPRHRVRRLVAYARDASRIRAAGQEADKWTALSACAMWEADVLQVDLKSVLDLLAGVAQDGDVMAATLRVQSVAGSPKVLEDNVKTLMTQPTLGAPGLNLAASMAALHLGNFTWAKTFWYRHQEDMGMQSPPPESPAALYRLWARDLHRQGHSTRGGFTFDTARHLPASAMECLVAVLDADPEDLITLRQLDSVLRTVPSSSQARVGYLSVLTLHERDDWRLALELALANVASFRLDSGMEEMQLAHALAEQAGQGNAFARVLRGRDPSGSIAARLGWPASPPL